MSKAKKMNLASIKKQMEALKEAQVQEEQRIKENIAKGLTSDVVEKLGEFNEADVKRIGTILSGYVDKAIKSLEAEKSQKKAKADAVNEVVQDAVENKIPEVADEADGDSSASVETPQVKSNYGYQQNGYQRNNGNF